MLSRAGIHTHIHTRTHMCTHTQAHTHTHTHTHMHTHTQAYQCHRQNNFKKLGASQPRIGRRLV